MRSIPPSSFLAALALCTAACALDHSALQRRCPEPDQPVAVLSYTHAGYLNVSDAEGAGALFYTYHEAAVPPANAAAAPILVWLQGGPGCSSLFGALYELGPELVTSELGLRPNEAAWNRHAGLLVIDQPAGTGFSLAGDQGTPTEEMAIAADLYVALQTFFQQHQELSARPVVIAGESYAGKYVPSIGHFILQQDAAAGGGGIRSSGAAAPAHTQRMPQHLAATRPLLSRPPLFRLRGLIIGDGLTNPALQVMTHADTAFAMGLVDARQRAEAMRIQLETAQLIAAEAWGAAHRKREQLLEYLAGAAGAATLLDVRRAAAYDANASVECYLNLPEVKEALGVPPGKRFESCSDEVSAALGPDVMQSVAYLVPDLLKAYPILLYQGAFDLQDGPPSSSAWIEAMLWPGREGFRSAQRRIISQEDIGGDPLHGGGSGSATQGTLESRTRSGAHGGVAAYWKQHAALTHVVLRNSGHMAPRDDPRAMQWVLETWLRREVLVSGRGAVL